MRFPILLAAVLFPFCAAAQTHLPPEGIPSPQWGPPAAPAPRHIYEPVFPSRGLPVEGGGVPRVFLGGSQPSPFIERETLDALENPTPVVPLSQAHRWLSGPAYVVDGDSFSIQGVLIRLAGIDAPEVDQLCYRGNIPHRCGIDAREWLAATIEDKRTDCEIHYIDAAQRAVATCWVNGSEINGWAIKEGQALVWEGAPSPYRGMEEDARRRQAGVWAFDFRHPAQWRTLTQAARDKADHAMQDGAAPLTKPFPYAPFTERNGRTMSAPVYTIPSR